jgi:NitT/TauT family transport system substrate-binding protein
VITEEVEGVSPPNPEGPGREIRAFLFLAEAAAITTFQEDKAAEMKLKFPRLSVVVFAFAWLTDPAAGAESQGMTKIRIAASAPSLSYLPIHVAVKKGYFARRGFEIEMIQMAAGLSTPALLNRAVDYTTIPSGVATAAARGAPLKVICFTSVKLQHLLISRPEIAAVADLAGKRIGAGGFGNLPAYEVRAIIDKFHLGPNTVIVPVNTSTDRLVATQRGTIDAAVVSAPLDLKAEEMGLKRLLNIGTILPIPQAGLATTDEKIKGKRGEVVELLKATIEGLDYTWTQREGVVEIIARWMSLTPSQAAKAYESVRETFSRKGVPSGEQAKAYISMLAATAGIGADISAAAIFDFAPAAEAEREMAAKK